MKELKVLDRAQKEIGRALSNLASLSVIESAHEKAVAEAYVKDAKKIAKDVERMRLGFTRVFDEWKAKFMNREKELTADLMAHIKTSTMLIDTYNNGVLEAVRRDTERISGKYDSKILAAETIEDSLELEVAKTSELSVLPQVEGARVMKKWAVDKLDKVPQEWWCLDIKRIDEAVKMGEEIEGIKVYHVTVRTGR